MIAAGVSILIATAGLVVGGHLRFVFFPSVEGEEIKVILEMPKGTPYEQTESTMNRIVEAAYRAVGGRNGDLHRNLLVTVGGELVSGFGLEGTRVSPETATATLELTPAGERDLTASDIEAKWRAKIGELAGIRSLSFSSEGLSGGDDIRLNLSNPDESILQQAVASLLDELKRIHGLAEVSSTTKPGSRQLEFFL